MKKYVYLISLMVTFFSCSSEESVQQGGTQEKTGIDGSSPVFIAVDEEFSTRSVVEKNPNDETTLKFHWSMDDILGVYSYKGGDQNIGITNFRVVGLDNDGHTAQFKGSGFKLDTSYEYYSFSHFNVSMQQPLEDITMSFEGQRMVENNSTENLGKYDYQAANADIVTEDYAHFAYQHLGAAIRVTIKGLPTGVAFNKFRVFRADGKAPNYSRHVDLLNSFVDEKYSPKLTIADSEDAVGERNEEYAIALGPEDGTGITPSGADNSIVIFFMLPNTKEFSGTQKWYCELLPADGSDKSYYITMNPKDEFLGGYYYRYSKTALQRGKLNVKLSVDKDWKLGNTIMQTRANQGDPGVDSNLDNPDKVALITCVDDKIYNITNLTVPTDGNWVENGNILTFDKAVAIEIAPVATSSINVYAYAYSSKAVPATLPSIAVSSSTGGDAAVQGATFASSSQDALKNLYSTPYLSTGYQGTVTNLSANPMFVDLILYHTAAKVDVQWNCKPAVSGSVSVNNVPTSGLFMFKPTENTTASDKVTFSDAITPGTMYNGRQVFYLPQFANPTYSITVGEGSTQDVLFAPSVENGWTSWLKANIKKGVE